MSTLSFANMSPQTAKKFKYWQTRTIVASMVGYAIYYFVRKNLSIAMPGMQADLGISKTDLGIFLTLHGLLYGLSKFVNGFFSDRSNARVFMVTGLVLSALANVFFGLSSAILVLGLIWMLNGWFQGMGFPPIARLMTHWVPPNQLATKMSVWNTSHSIGAGAVVVVCGYIVANLGWRWCFYIPALIGFCGALYMWIALRDTPSSVGLPEIHGPKSEEENTSTEFKKFLRKKVFGNPYIWLISIANFFVYTIRYAVLDWGPTLLTETKGLQIHHAGWMVAAFEVAGIAGMLAAGWLTDKVFGGRGIRMCFFCMVFATLFIFMFWQINTPSILLATIILGAAGFFIYGPQALIGIIAANMATNKAAGTAAGFTGLFGYLSTILSGWGLGFIAQHYGWNYAIGGLIAVGIAGAITFILGWGAKPHGYDEDSAVPVATK